MQNFNQNVFRLIVLLSFFAVVINCEEFDSNSFESENDDFSDEYSDDLGKTKFTSELYEKIFFFWNIIRNTAYFFFHNGAPEKFSFLSDNYPYPPGIFEEYDFIVVGAGPAGSVIASRLSENPGWNVLLLEAGGPENLITDIPAIAASLQSTDYNWGYRQEWQEGLCIAMEDQRCNWPRGKAIGGTSVINYMIYTRGNRIDWDRIAAAGNPGWSYEEVLPYFLKSEKANLQEGLENSPNHNKYGLMSVEHIPYKTPLVDAFLEAAVELGHNIVDYNQGDQFGFGRVQAQTKEGRRHSAAKAFLFPFRDRQNLHIVHHARVIKININEETKSAESVDFVLRRRKFTVKAKREIILSAGAFGSPQLLMLSGVGPKEHLQEFGLPVIKDLKVGQNMYDHICFFGLLFHLDESIYTGAVIEQNVISNISNTLSWINNQGRSSLSLIGTVEALGYIKTKVSDEIENFPDMELIFSAGSPASDARSSEAFRKGLKVTDEFYAEMYRGLAGKPMFTIIPMIVHPKSKGYMKLKDSNPFHWPKFYYDYFYDDRDMQTFVEAIKYIIRLTETEPFKRLGARLYTKPFPNCKKLVFGSDEYWRCALRTLSATLHHQIGTCKMGPASDPEAVVDHELRVHGIKRLRVADTSVIPKPITAHTNAPSVMVGEKLSDMLKATWRSYNEFE